MAIRASEKDGFFKIPSGLNNSVLDKEVPIEFKSATTPPIPVRVLLYYIVTVSFVIWSLMQTFMGRGPAWLIALYVLLAVYSIIFFGTYSKTKEMRWQSVPALMRYAARESRRLRTRRTDDAGAFRRLVNIKDIESDGLIRFNDGGVGRMFVVVGNASRLLFDQDKAHILDRVDAFWKKADVNCEHIYITSKESQEVYHQVAALDRRNERLRVDDPELRELIAEQVEVLENWVAGTDRDKGISLFNPIQQRLVIRSTNEEQLRLAVALLRDEARSSSLMFKSVTPLDRKGVERAMRMIYRGRDVRTVHRRTR